MADHFRSGDYYLRCDRTGFKIRASEAKREWTGAVVRKESWEPRHPQDFVRAKSDNQVVGPLARPDPIEQFMGMLHTKVTQVVTPGSQVVYVENVQRFFAGDKLKITLDNNEMWPTIIQIVNSDSFVLTNFCPDHISVGAMVVNETAVALPQF